MQSILPDWSLQRVEVNNFAGEPTIEKDVVENVASYGKQLGILTEAVLALAGDAPEERSARIERLRGIAAQIDAVKVERNEDLVASARRAMESLAKINRSAARSIAADYTGEARSDD